MSRKILRIGLDFDGVVAYNPFRVVRAPWAFFKRHVMGVRKLTFYYPQNNFQRIFWKILHESSMFPANGVDLLPSLVKEGRAEFHLISARYSFLDDHLTSWLKKHKLHHLFKTININKRDMQPHLFKEVMLKKYQLDAFVEDNWDIVSYLHTRTKTKIYWIYNIIDRFRPFPRKYPFLRKAIEAILE